MLLTSRAYAITVTIVLTSSAPAQEAHATSGPVDEGMMVFLDATVGYGGYYRSVGFLDSEKESLSSAAPIYSGSVSLTWPPRRGSKLRVGIRLSGLYGKMRGEAHSSSLMSSRSAALSATLAGGHVGVVAQRKGLWGALSGGVLHLHDNSWDNPYRSSSESSRTYFTPEMCFAIGYNLYLVRFLAFRLHAEVGLFPYPLLVRGSINAGVFVRI